LTVVVRDQAQAVETAKSLVNKEGVESIILCPGFTNKAIAEIDDAVLDALSQSHQLRNTAWPNYPSGSCFQTI